MPNNIVTIESHDDASLFVITAQATGPTTASVAERKSDKASGAVTNSSLDLYGVEVVNGILQGQAHIGFQTANVTLTLSPPGDNPSATIAISHMWIGNQTLGPFQLVPADYASLTDWLTNFPHS